ncbi:hypothetical protein NPX13_g550 [Xylaria arbuscula]|uniref:Uncharacterized protein n=1 Tax=Xylaria arbuscula TaxID=114810 RepID=A0A9W8TR04_9PEZI|nr:hypothetical protein NPX13_g550 [Xylaria arbuscula]
MDTSDYTSSHDFGYVSDPGYASDFGAGSATGIYVSSSPTAKQPSRALYGYAASQFIIQFARRLAYRSGAHTWGESVLARLDYVQFIDQFRPILSAALALLDHQCLFIDYLKPLLTAYLDSSGSVKEILHQLGEDICVHFHGEMKSDHSGHEMVLTDVKAMTPFAEL